MKPSTTPKREVDIVVISDTHLGAFGCHANELLSYLKSIKPGLLILNGDIIDIWQFRKSYFPKSHMLVIRQIIGLIAKKTNVVYICGNHDELLRRFIPLKISSFSLTNKLLINLDHKKAWIFHGDVFDVTMQYSKWLAKLGSVGYDLLIMINSIVNFLLEKTGREKISFSKKIKHTVKTAVSYINKFEETAAEIAISKGYSHVICGHIHQPEIRKISNQDGEVVYLNSGDWVENLSSLEYHKGVWRIYRYREDEFIKSFIEGEMEPENLNDKETFSKLLQEFKLVQKF